MGMFDDLLDDKETGDVAVAPVPSQSESSMFSDLLNDDSAAPTPSVSVQPESQSPKGMFDDLLEPVVAQPKTAPTKPVVPPMTRFAAPMAPVARGPGGVNAAAAQDVQPSAWKAKKDELRAKVMNNPNDEAAREQYQEMLQYGERTEQSVAAMEPSPLRAGTEAATEGAYRGARAGLGGMTSGVSDIGAKYAERKWVGEEVESPTTGIEAFAEGGLRMAGGAALTLGTAGTLNPALSKVAASSGAVAETLFPRLVVGSAVAGANQISLALQGKTDLKTAVQDFGISAMSGMVSALPEFGVDRGIKNFAAQVFTDLVYDAVTDKYITGRLNSDVGLRDWFLYTEIPQLAMSVGFALKDNLGDPDFKAQQAAVRQDLRAKAQAMLRSDVDARDSAIAKGEPPPPSRIEELGPWKPESATPTAEQRLADVPLGTVVDGAVRLDGSPMEGSKPSEPPPVPPQGKPPLATATPGSARNLLEEAKLRSQISEDKFKREQEEKAANAAIEAKKFKGPIKFSDPSEKIASLARKVTKHEIQVAENEGQLRSIAQTMYDRIYVHRWLLNQFESGKITEGELAYIIAHESIHMEAGHRPDVAEHELYSNLTAAQRIVDAGYSAKDAVSILRKAAALKQSAVDDGLSIDLSDKSVAAHDYESAAKAIESKFNLPPTKPATPRPPESTVDKTPETMTSDDHMDAMFKKHGERYMDAISKYGTAARLRQQGQPGMADKLMAEIPTDIPRSDLETTKQLYDKEANVFTDEYKTVRKDIASKLKALLGDSQLAESVMKAVGLNAADDATAAVLAHQYILEGSLDRRSTQDEAFWNVAQRIYDRKGEDARTVLTSSASSLTEQGRQEAIRDIAEKVKRAFDVIRTTISESQSAVPSGTPNAAPGGPAETAPKVGGETSPGVEGAAPPPKPPSAAKQKIVSVEDITGRDGRGFGLTDGFSMPIKSVITSLLVKGKRLFGVQRGLPDIVFKGEREKTGMIAAAGMRAKFLARDIDRAIGSLPSSTNEIEILKNVNSALHGDSSIDDLPIELRAATRALRDHIDSLSEELKPYVGETLQATISANKNIYMNRSFRLHDDPKWGEKVREKFPQLMTQMRDAYMADDPTLTQDAAEGMVDAILEDNGPAGEQRFASTGQIGGRDASSLMKRKELSEPFRALIGEYKDWKVNYFRTIFKTSKLIAQSKINRQMADEGMGTIFFDAATKTHYAQINKDRFDKAVGRNKGNIELALSQNQDKLDEWLGEMRFGDQMGVPFKQLSPEAEIAVKGRIKRIAESQANAEHPLDNLYTTPEIAEAIALYDAPQSSEAWLRYSRLFMGRAKLAATAYSIQTGQRNILSNIGVMTSQGYTDVGEFKKSMQSLLTDLGAKKDSELREQLIEYARLHVTGESANAGELRDAIKAATAKNADFEDFMGMSGGPVAAGNFLTGVMKKAGRGALWYYKWGDDIFKIYAYENELKSLRESYAGTKSEEEMKREAAEITSAVIPTSSLAPEIVKMIASNPIFGGFVTFHAEILRTQVNTTLRAAHELKTPGFRKRGAKRLAGQMLTHIAFASLSTAARALRGMKKEDEDDTRRFVAPWSRNSSIALLRKDGPTISFIDLGYLNPFAIIHKPIMAAYRGLSEDDMLKAGYEAMTEFFEPLLGDGILSKKMKDVWSNHIEQSGKFVANPELPFASRQAARVKYIAPIFVPAAIRSTIPKVYRAINKIPEKSGVVLDPKTEVIAAMGGQRVTTLNINKQIGYKARDAQRRYENARQIFLEKANSRGAITAKDLQLAYSQMNNAVIDIRSELRKDVSAAVRQGVPNAIVMDAIKKANTDKNLYDNAVGFEDRLTKVNISEYQKTIPGREKLIRGALPLEAVREKPGKLPSLRL